MSEEVLRQGKFQVFNPERGGDNYFLRDVKINREKLTPDQLYDVKRNRTMLELQKPGITRRISDVYLFFIIRKSEYDAITLSDYRRNKEINPLIQMLRSLEYLQRFRKN